MRRSSRWSLAVGAVVCAAWFGPALAAPAAGEPLPVYGTKAPRSADTEIWEAGEVRNVTRPTLTPVLPKSGKATGAAVIVLPGGAFMKLAMEKEGLAVAHALADRGIAAFVLKYRLLTTPADSKEALAFMSRKFRESFKADSGVIDLRNPEATQDLQAAMALVHRNAAQWGLDPARIGTLGFSAGARAELDALTAAQTPIAPAFMGYIYGPQMQVSVPVDAPPLFAALAIDDPLFAAKSFPLVQSWIAAKRPVELHAYQKGGHGFGLGQPGTTAGLLIDEFVTWMRMQGFIRQTNQQGDWRHGRHD